MGDQTTEQMRAAVLRQAVKEATAAVERKTTLRGKAALNVAAAVLDAGGKHLRSEMTLRLAGTTRTELVTAAVSAAAVVVLDMVVLGTIAVKGPRQLRYVAGLTYATRAGFIIWAKRRDMAIYRANRDVMTGEGADRG